MRHRRHSLFATVLDLYAPPSRHSEPPPVSPAPSRPLRTESGQEYNNSGVSLTP